MLQFAPMPRSGPERADITCIGTAEGWLYLATVMDLFTRRIVGRAMAEHLGHALALAALDMAIINRRPAAEGCQNRRRRHAAIGYLTPEQMAATHKAADR